MKNAATTITPQPAIHIQKQKFYSEGEQLMDKLSTLYQQRDDLVKTIVEELKGIELGLKETNEKLIQIGNDNKKSFDVKGNLHFTAGYLHIAKNSVIVKGRKFDEKAFRKRFPDFVNVTFNLKPIKDAWNNIATNRELRKLKIRLNNIESMEVKMNPKTKE